jgi:DNA-binding transcriptional ArsR family regulator
MSEPLGMLPEIDRQVHEPARLAILTVLSACERADFLFLERATGLTRGNLSVQLSRLEEAGLIEIEKTIVRKKTVTTAALLGYGRGALESYWEQMAELRARSVAPQKAAAERPRGMAGRPAVAGGKA